MLTHNEVRGLAGDTHLEEITLEHTPSGDRQTIGFGGLFCFVGAIPATGWLRDCVSLDRNGFVLTDRSLSDDDVNADAFGGRDPLPFETSPSGRVHAIASCLLATGAYDLRQGNRDV